MLCRTSRIFAGSGSARYVAWLPLLHPNVKDFVILTILIPKRTYLPNNIHARLKNASALVPKTALPLPIRRLVPQNNRYSYWSRKVDNSPRTTGRLH